MGGRGCGCEGDYCDAHERRRCCECRAPYDCAGHWDWYPTCDCHLVEWRRCGVCCARHPAEELVELAPDLVCCAACAVEPAEGSAA